MYLLQMFNENDFTSESIWPYDCQNFIPSGARLGRFDSIVSAWDGAWMLASFKRAALWNPRPAFLSVWCAQHTAELRTITVPTLKIFAWLIFPDVCISSHDCKQLFILNKWGGTLKGRIIHFYEGAAVEIYNFCRNFHFGGEWKFNTCENYFSF